jgi:hypothetical protein
VTCLEMSLSLLDCGSWFRTCIMHHIRELTALASAVISLHLSQLLSIKVQFQGLFCDLIPWPGHWPTGQPTYDTGSFQASGHRLGAHNHRMIVWIQSIMENPNSSCNQHNLHKALGRDLSPLPTPKAGSELKVSDGHSLHDSPASFHVMRN